MEERDDRREASSKRRLLAGARNATERKDCIAAGHGLLFQRAAARKQLVGIPVVADDQQRSRSLREHLGDPFGIEILEIWRAQLDRLACLPIPTPQRRGRMLAAA